MGCKCWVDGGREAKAWQIKMRLGKRPVYVHPQKDHTPVLLSFSEW